MTTPEAHFPSLRLTILRWVTFFPASVAGYIVAYTFFFHIASWNLGLLSHIPTVLPDGVISFMQSTLPTILASMGGGIVLVMLGAAVAPRYRTAVSLALLILNTCVFSLYAGAYLIGLLVDRPFAEVISEFAGGLVGTVAAFYIVVRRVGWDSNAPISHIWRPESQVV